MATGHRDLAVAALAFGQDVHLHDRQPGGVPGLSVETGRLRVSHRGLRRRDEGDKSTVPPKGLVQGARKSVALKLMAMSTPGVYAVYPTWPR